MAASASNRLIIIGAGGFGRELLAWIRHYRLALEFIGFIDDEKSAEDVKGPIRGHDPDPAVRYACALGDPIDRFSVVRSLEGRGARFANIVSPYAQLVSSPAADSGFIGLGDVSVANDVALGRHILLQGRAIIGHNVAIDDFATIGSFAFVGGGARVGARATLHPHSMVLPRLRIGEDAIVGAGSVVTRNVPSATTVFGNPACALTRRSSSPRTA
jgi:sugar O-acyltransferase (sialic acid O-acetyltransferase NeuD family)